MSTSPAFSFTTTAEEVASAISILITGTSLNGIGFEASRVIAKYANLVIITGYNAERLKLSEEAIKTEFPDAHVRRLVLDLGSLGGVRKAAAEVNSYAEPLHVLIHNAAAAVGPFKLTEDSLESQIATDHVGPFLLTKLLTPKLLASSGETYTPRVVFISSEAHAYGAGVDLEMMEVPNAEKYDSSNVYFQAKSASILTARELSRRSGGKINAYSLHPGLIFTNMNQKEESLEALQAVGFLGPDKLPNTEKYQWKTIPQGAATIVAAAFDPRLNDQPGAYLNDSAVANQAVAAHSSDPVKAQELWSTTERIIGETFAF
ncbi:hypothetical protein B0H11DRAFT_2214825 [Mycena galericulata]|nr:hypothetical protein B0H11DRAFT_2214825 [Mycena galericulata]